MISSWRQRQSSGTLAAGSLGSREATVALSKFGAHLPGGRDLRPAVGLADRLGFETFQVFLHGPTTGKMPQGTEEDDREFRSMIEERSQTIFVHGPYLMNFGSSKDSARENSVEMLRKNMRRAERIGARGVVFHGGSSTGATIEEGLDRLRETLLPVLEELPADGPKVILGPTAGQGNSLVAKLDSIPAYLAALDDHPLLGLCLDTCHLLAAGEPLDEPDGGADLVAQIAAYGLRDRLELFHANDSAFERGAHRDRHANLATGHCARELWGQLMGSGVPLILETPGSRFRQDIELLRALSAQQ